ncbi:MAG: peptidoglycan editing factor PgeF [Bryobacterales bacterium]|nr:peptidoglycan editing factor PgeF [Bryobacterales bacterium]
MAIRKAAGALLQVGGWDWAWLDHGFGTRDAGPWTPAQRTATLKQIHSDAIVRVNGQRGQIGEGDALITNEAGVHLTVRTADCVPVLLVDPVRRAVAAVHAGWRGTAASIVAKTVARMREEFGSDAGDVRAAIGPCIQRCCYEVGPDVASRFTDWFPELGAAAAAVRIDLAETNRRQLFDAGVREIAVADGCTQCVAGEYHSFRRDKEQSGRMVTGIAIREL